MIQEWNDVEFKSGTSASAKYDLVVADFGSRMTILESLKNKAAAKEAVSEELRKLKKEENPGSDPVMPKTIHVSYEGKGGLTAVILMGNAGSYFVQEAIRKAFAGIMNTDENAREVNIDLRGLKESQAEGVIEWIASLALMVRWRAPVYGKKEKEQKKTGYLTVFFQHGINKKIADAAIKKGKVLGFNNNQVRYLADMPSNMLNPKTYREIAEKIAKNLNVDCEFIDKKNLTKRNAGAFLAVVQADLNDRAGIVHLHYSPKGGLSKGKNRKKVAIVGKGLCFDTGGINVKVGDFMYNMHRDMTGSAVALSLFCAMVEMDSPYEIDCYLAIAENLISHAGFRPNDIVIASNGMSIEVIDTDAEGRMVLSDTLAIASLGKPDFLIDFATLTGSVVRSIDTRRCGAYSNQLRISMGAVEVGERCGERVWNFPIGQDYNEALKSEYADIRQCASAAAADHIYAATFLSKFVGKDIPWIHIDLAADTNKGGLGLCPTETTGFGVRFGYELIKHQLD